MRDKEDFATGSRRAVYVVVQNFFNDDTVINGGSQSARNLLLGLRALGCSLRIISWNTESRTEASQPSPSLEWKNCELGEITAIALPPLRNWRDPVVVAKMGCFLRQLVETNTIFHLLEPKEYLGSWLAALESTNHEVVVTALDYAWICATSHLLTRQGEQCSGPRNAASCLQCFYNHRHPVKALALKLLLASTAVPLRITRVAPGRLQMLIEDAKEKRTWTETRLASLKQDFERVDAVVAPSRILGQLFAANGLPENKLYHIPYGTQAGQKLTLDDRPPLGEGVVFGFVGKLTFDKGLDLLIEALSQLRAKTLSCRLVVYGNAHPSHFGQAILKRINRLSWIELRQFDGRDPVSIDEAHRNIHFQVAPSRWTDNLPNAVLEGVERQTPVIAPNYGSFPEMIKDGVNGWLYPANSVANLKEILSRIIATPLPYLRLPFDAEVTRRPKAEAEDVFRLYQTLEKR